MTSIVLDSDDLYVGCSTKTKKGDSSEVLQVYRLKNSVKDYMVMDDDWDMESCRIDPRSISRYNSLVINGSTVDIDLLTETFLNQGLELPILPYDFSFLVLYDACFEHGNTVCYYVDRFRVNRVGNCLYKILQKGPLAASTATISSTNSAENFRYYRMNDMRNWATYGVKADPDKKHACVRWDRLDILRGTPMTCNLYEMEQELVEMKNELELTRHTISILEDNNILYKHGNAVLKEVLETRNSKAGCTSTGIHDLKTRLVSPDSFNILSITMDAIRHNLLYLRDHESEVTTVNPILSLSRASDNNYFHIFVNEGVNSFDSNNWYLITTVQCTHLLVYLGSRHYVKIGSYDVEAPLDPNKPYFLTYSLELDTSFRPFYGLTPMMIAGSGIKFCILVNTGDEETPPQETVEEGVGLCQVIQNLFNFR